MKKPELGEVTDLSNLLLYRLKNSNDCELTQDVIDRFRNIVHELLVENAILEADKNKINWHYENLLNKD